MDKTTELIKKFDFHTIRPDEIDGAIFVEQNCFPPNEACAPNAMRERIRAAGKIFLVAVVRETGQVAGILNGLATDETVLRDEFFTDAGLHDPNGKNIMITGLAVLPEYQGQGLARVLMETYVQREKKNGRKLLILTCLSEKVEMYKKLGYEDRGISASAWGGEEWHEMIRDISE